WNHRGIPDAPPRDASVVSAARDNQHRQGTTAIDPHIWQFCQRRLDACGFAYTQIRNPEALSVHARRASHSGLRPEAASRTHAGRVAELSQSKTQGWFVMGN